MTPRSQDFFRTMHQRSFLYTLRVNQNITMKLKPYSKIFIPYQLSEAHMGSFHEMEVKYLATLSLTPYYILLKTSNSADCVKSLPKETSELSYVSSPHLYVVSLVLYVSQNIHNYIIHIHIYQNMCISLYRNSATQIKKGKCKQTKNHEIKKNCLAFSEIIFLQPNYIIVHVCRQM